MRNALVSSPYCLAQACQALGCMEHRGACSADNDSGDGSGIMTQIPWEVIEADVGPVNRETTGWAPLPKIQDSELYKKTALAIVGGTARTLSWEYNVNISKA